MLCGAMEVARRRTPEWMSCGGVLARPLCKPEEDSEKRKRDRARIEGTYLIVSSGLPRADLCWVGDDALQAVSAERTGEDGGGAQEASDGPEGARHFELCDVAVGCDGGGFRW